MATEFLPLVNNRKYHRCEIHDGNNVLHPAIHLLIYNMNNEVVVKYWWHVAFEEIADKALEKDIKLLNKR